MLDVLKGKKTYLVAALTATYGLVAHHQSLSTLAPYVLTGALGAALRAAIAKVEAGVAAAFAKVEAVEAKLPAVVAKPAVAATKAVETAVDAAEAVANKNVAAK